MELSVRHGYLELSYMIKVGSDSLFSEIGLLSRSMFFSDAEVCMFCVVGREKY